MAEEPEESNEEPIRPFLFWAFLILLGIVLYYLLVSLLVPLSQRSQFGDTFSGFNALFSGLAFAAVVYALRLQRRDLKLQRDEFRATREEMRRSANAQEAAERVFNDQLAALNAQATAMRAQAETLSSQLRPIVLAQIIADGYEVFWSLKNFGNRPAYNVVVTPGAALETIVSAGPGNRVTIEPMMSQTFMAPGFEVTHLLNLGGNVASLPDESKRVDVTISYDATPTPEPSKRFVESYVIDVGRFMYGPRLPQYSSQYHLRAISRALGDDSIFNRHSHIKKLSESVAGIGELLSNEWTKTDWRRRRLRRRTIAPAQIDSLKQEESVRDRPRFRHRPEPPT